MTLFNYMRHQHIVPLLILAGMCLAPSVASAQQEKQEEASEIVMTAEQLESLLTRIAEKRKQRNQELQAPILTLQPMQSMGRAAMDPNLYQELRILNAKLDLLLGQSGQLQPGATTVQVQTPYGNYLQPVAPTETPETPETGETSQTPQAPGTTSLNSGTTAAETDRAKHFREAFPSLTVFFEHDKATLNAQEIEQLEALAPKIQAYQADILVVLRGFASQVGNAYYNNQLSFKRADAVKAVLIRQGVDPKNIMTLFHGEDPTQDAAQARRVEVNFETLQR